MEEVRQSQLIKWLQQVFSVDNIVLSAMNGDAGFRRYFRFYHDKQSFVAVDSPNDKCNNDAFIQIQQKLIQQGIIPPEIVAIEEDSGFFCLSDLGDNLLANIVTEHNMIRYYQAAIDLLPKVAATEPSNIPAYDEALIRTELSIFPQWLLTEHLAIELSAQETAQMNTCFEILISNALEQPQVVMHRDFHSRNIMERADGQLALIDFQDAVIGPITYDIVSLLRDCYLKWPAETIAPLFDYFQQQIADVVPVQGVCKTQWQLWFDLMGLQRHIKASGIFARLHHRDGKSGYLKDIPLTLSYIVDVAAKYPELSFLSQFIENRVLPILTNTKENKLV